MDVALVLLTLMLVHLLAVISPGPSFLVTARAAVSSGRQSGLGVALGMALGALIWAVAALAGLNYVLARFDWLYTALRFAGGAYLLWLAFKLWVHAGDPMEFGTADATPNGRSAIMRGLFVQLANPKVVVFFSSVFVALLPQSTPPWMMVLVLVIVCIDEFIWYALVATGFSAGWARERYLRLKPAIDRVTGTFLGFLGVRLILSE